MLATLSAGVPLVVVPTAWDQPENAWRVAEAGAGIRLPPRQCTPEQVRIAVQRVLSDKSFRWNAGQMATDFARYGGSAQAADLLEDLAVRQGDRSHREGALPTQPAGGKVLPSASDTMHAVMRSGVRGDSR